MSWKSYFRSVIGHEIKFIALLVAACLLVSTTGLSFYGLLIVGLLCYVVYHLYQGKLLLEWLSAKQRSGPPDEIRGIWSLIAAQVHRKNKYHAGKDERNRKVIGQFTKVSQAIPDGIVILDSRGRIDWFNEPAGKLLGLSRKQDIGTQIIQLVRDPGFINFFQNKELEKDLRLNSPVDNKIKLNLRLVSFYDKHLIIVQDFTTLQRMEQMRQDFVANVSHELRTPLSVIVGYLETLAEEDDEELAAYQPVLWQMKQQSDRMTRLVEDLLTLSNLDNEQTINNNQQVAVPSMLNGILDDAIILSGTKKQTISLHANPDLWLLGNTRELHGAFSNLVANAVNYTPMNGEITIRWFREDDDLIMSVKDTGQGIDNIHIDRLTERFYRVDKGRSRNTGGTGLGLAIVKHALQRHDATLKIESQIGKGSTFRCVFPLERGIENPLETPDTATSSESTKTPILTSDT